MTRSSRSRRLRARAKKRALAAGTRISQVATDASSGVAKSVEPAALPTLSKKDKIYMTAFAILSLIVTLFYWSLGGRNLFVFPALFCISVGARKYWSGPIRRFADDV